MNHSNKFELTRGERRARENNLYILRHLEPSDVVWTHHVISYQSHFLNVPLINAQKRDFLETKPERDHHCIFYFQVVVLLQAARARTTLRKRLRHVPETIEVQVRVRAVVLHRQYL